MAPKKNGVAARPKPDRIEAEAAARAARKLDELLLPLEESRGELGPKLAEELLLALGFLLEERLLVVGRARAAPPRAP